MQLSISSARGTFIVLFFASATLVSQDERFTLRVSLPQSEARTGQELGATVFLDATVPGVQGWSLGVAHDPQVVEILDAAPGAVTSTSNSGGEPNFLVINKEPAVGSGVTMAVVISFTRPFVLAAGPNQDLLTMQYKVVADPATADPCVPISTELAFSDTLGEPAVGTVITFESGSIAPVKVNAPITVGCPGKLEFSRCEGDTDNVYLEWGSSSATPYDALFLYRDAELLQSLDPTTTSYTDEKLPPGDYEYTLITFVVEDPAHPQLIFAYCKATVIPLTVTGVEPKVGYFIGGDTITVTGTAFTTAAATKISFVGVPPEADLPLEVLEVTSPNELKAKTPASPRLGFYTIRVENERGFAELANAFEYGFIRAEINGDGKVDLSDPVALLTFLFVEVQDPPMCLDAADANDSGKIDISDAVNILGFLFLGSAPPKPPFPGPGSDPTKQDPYGCLQSVTS